MSTQPINRWIVPGLAGGAVMIVSVALTAVFVRVKPPPGLSSGTVSPVKPQIVIVPKAKSEDLFSFEPLFLPTARNTSVLALPSGTRREPGATAETFPPKLNPSFGSVGGVPLPELFPPPAKLVDVMDVGQPPNPWPEVGRADVPVPVLPARLAYLEVVLARTGKMVLAEAVPAGPGAQAPIGSWAPLEYTVAIDSAGLVGAPISVPTTDDSAPPDEVESFFRDFLARKFQLGAKIGPGFYTVRIGP